MVMSSSDIDVAGGKKSSWPELVGMPIMEVKKTILKPIAGQMGRFFRAGP